MNTRFFFSSFAPCCFPRNRMIFRLTVDALQREVFFIATKNFCSRMVENDKGQSLQESVLPSKNHSAKRFSILLFPQKTSTLIFSIWLIRQFLHTTGEFASSRSFAITKSRVIKHSSKVLEIKMTSLMTGEEKHRLVSLLIAIRVKATIPTSQTMPATMNRRPFQFTKSW